MDDEIQIMKLFVAVVDYGSFTSKNIIGQDETLHFVIMPRYARTLKSMSNLTTFQVLEIGISLIEQI